MKNEQNIQKMGGLKKKMPFTAAMMGIGTLAISGIPPLAGFWSKDEILLAQYIKGHPENNYIIAPHELQNISALQKQTNALLFSEYAMWALFIFSNDQYSSYRNDYRNHGEHYAGVDWLSKNDLYAANVGNFTCLSYDDCGDEAYNVIKAQNFLWDDMYPEGEGYESCRW